MTSHTMQCTRCLRRPAYKTHYAWKWKFRFGNNMWDSSHRRLRLVALSPNGSKLCFREEAHMNLVNCAQ